MKEPGPQTQRIRELLREGREHRWIVCHLKVHPRTVRRIAASLRPPATFPSVEERRQRHLDTTAITAALRTA